MFFAGQHINVERTVNGQKKLVALSPGDPCPEAAEWDQDVLMRNMKVGKIVDMDKAPKVKGSLVKMQADQQSLAKAAQAKEAKASKPTSTHEAAHGKAVKQRSSADAARAARKQAAAAAEVAPAVPVRAKAKLVTREVAGVTIPVRNVPKREAPARARV